MADGITRIAVEGFKSIVNKQSIDIAPLTILAGANSSGKSSIMQPLLLLKQTLEAPYDPGTLKIDGPNVTFTSSDQFLSSAGGQGLTELSIELAVGESRFNFCFSKGPGSGLDIKNQTRVFRGVSSTLSPNMSPDGIREVIKQVYGIGESLPFSIVRNRFFLDVDLVGGLPFRVMSLVSPLILHGIHVSGFRGNFRRTYPITGAGPRFPGTFEKYTASVIAHWQSDDDERYRALNYDLEHVGLTRVVFASPISEVELDLQVSRNVGTDHSEMDSIADVGFGVSQVLPILVALRAADEGQLVYLEEPEIHLHPRAQTKLAHVLADAAERGVRVVAETHSTLLLTAIQTLVAKGELDRKLVKLHWFQRDPNTGVTKVSSADLDENGAFGEWPEDFDKVILDAEGAYLDAVEGRQVG